MNQGTNLFNLIAIIIQMRFDKMIIQIYLTVLVLSLVSCGAPNPPQTKQNKLDKDKEDREQARLIEFFGKYCNEEDDKILAKLEKCEEIQPAYIKRIELECIKAVLKKKEKPSYKEIQMVECDDDLGLKFDDCENEKTKNNTINKTEQAKLAQIAKKIMFCGFDCYGIKHD